MGLEVSVQLGPSFYHHDFAFVVYAKIMLTVSLDLLIYEFPPIWRA